MAQQVNAQIENNNIHTYALLLNTKSVGWLFVQSERAVGLFI